LQSEASTLRPANLHHSDADKPKTNTKSGGVLI
jgi:hypothetical protein